MTVGTLPKKPKPPEPIDEVRRLAAELRLALEAGRLTPALATLSKLTPAIEHCIENLNARAFQDGRKFERLDLLGRLVKS